MAATSARWPLSPIRSRSRHDDTLTPARQAIGRASSLASGSVSPVGASTEAASAGESRSVEARPGARGERTEPGRGPDHRVLRLAGLRLPAHHLVLVLDRIWRREVSLRPAHD